ncbi:hypothetical protein O3S80_03305 [Streptomyces sp. Lzd4kr]|nr:hypothetical protein [Streptomyces sp. Lzd4kr]
MLCVDRRELLLHDAAFEFLALPADAGFEGEHRVVAPAETARHAQLLVPTGSSRRSGVLLRRLSP